MVGPEEKWWDRLLGFGVPVDADDHLVAGGDRALGAVRFVLDELLHPSRLDARHGAATSVHLIEQGLGATLELVGEPLDVVRPRHRVDRVGDAGFLRENLLRAYRYALRFLRRYRECLVVTGER